MSKKKFCEHCQKERNYEHDICRECAEGEAIERRVYLESWRLNDKVVLQLLDELDRYRKLGSYEELADRRCRMDIEAHCAELQIE